jgi:hypothetical protein
MPKKLANNTLVGDVQFEWSIQEYEQHSRNFLWYALMTVVGVCLVLTGIFTGNFLFSLIIILFAIILFLQSHQTPPQITFKITELGLVIGGRFYPYQELSDFFIVYNPLEGIKTLFVETKSVTSPLLRIPLLDENPLEVKQVLGQYLLENLEKEEPLSERLARNWRLH